MWRFIPFYLALIAAPLLFGGVKPESQAVLGILLSLGLIFTSNGGGSRPVVPFWLKVAFVALMLVQVLPLPFAVVKLLSPERARLAVEFPIDGVVPAWVTLSTSPARTAQRLWELALAAAAFVLARRHAAIPGAKRRLVIAVSIPLILLGAADIWSRQHGRASILNIWAVSWGKGYGTFANHNHFANWIYVASLFTIGWTVRELLRRDRPANRSVLLLATMATAFSLTMAFLSASRSGTIAFVFGLGAFALMMRKNFQKGRSFALVTSLILVGAIVIGLLAAEPFLTRMRSESTASTLALKAQLWAQTLRLASRFPIFGAGAGSFARVFDHYKSSHGDVTFLHAENDFVEVPFEFGIPFAILAFACFGFFVVRTKTESPARAGLAAALVVFLFQIGVEFISYIPANLILGAAFAGTLLGESDATFKPSLFSRVAAGTMFLIAVSQLCASLFYFRAANSGSLADLDCSISAWPFVTERQIARIRLASKSESADEIDRAASRALKLDPLNWSLRLEQTWFELAYTTNTARALSNAWLTARLNPLQAQIPLRFARHFQKSDPDLALQFLAAADTTIPANHFAALDLAWKIARDPEQLWKLTPNATNALVTLARFANEKKIEGTATQACRALEKRLPDEAVARLYLEAHRPNEAVRVLQNVGTLSAQALEIRALTDLHRDAEAVAVARKLFSSPMLASQLEQKIRPTSSYSELEKNYQEHPGDAVAALQLAERIAAMADPNVNELAALAGRFPNEARIALLLFQTQTNSVAAAQTAASLAERVLGR